MSIIPLATQKIAWAFSLNTKLIRMLFIQFLHKLHFFLSS